MVERVDYEQQGLVVVDFELLVDDPLQLDWIALNARRCQRVRQFSVRAEKSAAVGAKVPTLPHQAKLDSEPEEPRHRFDNTAQVANPLMLVLYSGYQIGRS